MKKIHTFWKVIFLIFTISFASVFAYIAKSMFNAYYGYYVDDEFFSDACTLFRYNDGTIKIYNKILRKTTTPRLDWISTPNTNDSILVFANKIRRGYLNKLTGEIIIPTQYSHAWNFSEGVGAVVVNNKVGFINNQAKVVIPFKFPYHPGYKNRIDFLFKDGSCTMANLAGKHGLIDKNGNWLIEPQYDYIQNPVYGYRKIKQGEKYGLLDKNFQWKFPIKYDGITVLKEGFLLFFDGTQQKVANDGLTIVLAFVYDDTQPIYYNSGNLNEAGDDILVKCDHISYRIQNKWGLLDKNGNVVVKAKYDSITALTKSLFSCQSGDYWITVDAKGELVH